jgi:hypothetical protein
LLRVVTANALLGARRQQYAQRWTRRIDFKPL